MSASEMGIAKAVLNRLNELGIPPTPEHFAQCYEELSGTDISALRGAEKNTEDRDELLNFLKSILKSVTETTHILSSSLSSQNRQIKGAVETLSQELKKEKILQSLDSLINTGNVIANKVGNAHDELEDIRRTLQEVQMGLSDNERWLQQDTTTGACNRFSLETALITEVARAKAQPHQAHRGHDRSRPLQGHQRALWL